MYRWVVCRRLVDCLGSIFGTLARNATGRRVGRHSAKAGIAGAVVGAFIAPVLYMLLQFGAILLEFRFFIQAYGVTLGICTVGFAIAVYTIYQRRI